MFQCNSRIIGEMQLFLNEREYFKCRANYVFKLPGQRQSLLKRSRG